MFVAVATDAMRRGIISAMKISCVVKPNTKHVEGIKQTDDGYVVSVKAPAVDGRANEAAKKLLAQHFGVRVADVRLVVGHHSRTKLFEITR